MTCGRREFLATVGGMAAAGLGAGTAHAGPHAAGPADPMGVLVDLGQCVGCRLCEYACKEANGIDPGPLESYDDTSVFQQARRPAPEALTVVNAWCPDGRAEGPVYTKLNCMHCNHPACASACIVGALRKEENGAVTYDSWKCIGCRYCMVACPFQLPAYSYDDVLTPMVRKCQFCVERTGQGKLPACVEACPRQTLTYGKRNELIAEAHRRIEAHPEKYVDHVYGEHEVGGTSWLYLSPVPFEQAGFLTLGRAAPPALTEAIQHGVFKYWIAPVGWYAFLAGMFWFTGRRAHAAGHGAGVRGDEEDPAVEEMRPHPGRRSHPSPSEGEVGRGWESRRTGNADLAENLERLTLPLSGGLPKREGGHDNPTDLAVLDPPAAAAADHAAHAHHTHHAHHTPPAPVRRKLMTPGVWVLLGLVVTGIGFGLYRFFVGMGASTHLDQQHPWGLWIAMDVGSGIALAGGGFVTAALVHIFHREHYEPIARSALLTALLGYTFYVPGLLADLGRWYNLWHTTLPSMWQGNSVLFEVGLCVMIYLNVQYAELAPILCEPVMGSKARFPRLSRLAGGAHRVLNRIMPALLVLGVCLSTFHQSSLGNLMVIAPYKLHPLWWTPVSPILFLLSAIMVGFPMVIFTILFASWALRRRPEMEVLAPLSRYVPVFLGLYLALKVGDVIVRGVWVQLGAGTAQSWLWLAEVGLGVALPLGLLLSAKVRHSPRWLAGACLAVILGVVLNRLNVFVLAYHPPFAEKTYIPSLTEVAVSVGLVSGLLLTYRAAVTYLPILHPQPEVER